MKTILAGKNFDLGFQSDIARDLLGRGAAFRLYDYIPENEASVRKRGGYTWATQDLNGLGGASNMVAVAWAPFSGDPHLIEIADTGRLYRSTKFDGATGDSLISATGLTPTFRPFWHRDRVLFLAGLNQAAASPQKYYDTGSLVYGTAAVGGSPPQARVGWSFGDYVALANGYVGGTLFPNRIWYSGVGNSDSWATGTSFFDVVEIEEIVAGTVLSNVQVVWGYSQCFLLLGDTPPAPGNLTKRFRFSQGCMDGRTLAKYREYAIWANETGIWKTDGSTLTDLTARCGISIFWRKLVDQFAAKQGWSACGGVIHGSYFITVTNSSGTNLGTVVIDVERESATVFTNVKATMYAEKSAGPGTSVADGHEELFFAHSSLPRAGQVSRLWFPSAANSADADGVDVLPKLETPYYNMGTTAEKRIKQMLIGYDLRAPGGGSPYLQVETIMSPEATSYRARTPTLPATTKKTRRSVDVREKSVGVGLRIVQVGASTDTRLYEIELAGYPHEASRDGR